MSLHYLNLLQNLAPIVGCYVLRLIRPSKIEHKISWRWVLKLSLIITLGYILLGHIIRPMEQYFFWHPMLCIYTYISNTSCVILCFLLFTFISYWAHRISHHVTWLWQYIHKVHHRQHIINTLSALYTHPLEGLFYTSLMLFCSLCLCGLGWDDTFWCLYIFNILALFQHSNISTPRWLGYVLVRPEMHKKHHELGHHRDNYGLIALWDIVFGTYTNPKVSPTRFGFTYQSIIGGTSPAPETRKALESINSETLW